MTNQEKIEERIKELSTALKQVEQQYLRILGQLDEANFNLQEELKTIKGDTNE